MTAPPDKLICIADGEWYRLPMPLLDHFNPPLNRTHPRRSFHGAWAAAIARLLNQDVLPTGYYAVPLLDRDGPIEIASESASNGGEPRGWAVPAPAVAVEVELASVDGVEVQVFADQGDPRLAAAVELPLPATRQ